MSNPPFLNKRRQLLLALGAVPVALSGGMSVAWAEDTARIDAARAAISELIAGREVKQAGITLTTPEIAENGNTVPLAVSVESAMSEAEHVRALHIFAEDNPAPQVASFYFTPGQGPASVSTRIRLARTQRVIALAEMSDDSLIQTANEVKVTIGGCGG